MFATDSIIIAWKNPHVDAVRFAHDPSHGLVSEQGRGKKKKEKKHIIVDYVKPPLRR